jgi:hypothetical protein
MTSTLNFDEKKFWIVLFSIVARREAVREQVIERVDELQKQQEGRTLKARCPGTKQENPMLDSDSDSRSRTLFRSRK